MYDRLVKNNPYIEKAAFVAFDNNKENLGISARYNSFLDNYDYGQEAWFVFCHEDWEVKEDLAERLKDLDKSCLYGPIGSPFAKQVLWSVATQGLIEESDKDGKNLRTAGHYNNKLQEVGTFDCQCLIVHSSLIQKYHLRFDENLLFDLYVEDFCINARENYGVSSRVLQLMCHHWSGGIVGENFYEKLKYLRHKYQLSTYIYLSTVYNLKITQGFVLDEHKLLKGFVSFLRYILKFIFQIKITQSNKLIVKIFKIPVFSKKTRNDGRTKCLKLALLFLVIIMGSM